MGFSHTFLCIFDGGLHCWRNPKKVVVNYHTTWWLFLNYFQLFFIMGLNGQNFPWVEISKSKIIGFYISVWRLFLQGLVGLNKKLTKFKQGTFYL